MFMLFFYTCTPLENKKHAWKNKTKGVSLIRLGQNSARLTFQWFNKQEISRWDPQLVFRFGGLRKLCLVEKFGS